MGTENVIDWLTGDSKVTLSLTQERFRNKVKKLAKEYPNECDVIENKDGSVFAHIPLTWLRIVRPTEVTDEERERRRETARRNFSWTSI